MTTDPKETMDNLKIMGGLVAGFIIGLLISMLVTDTYDIIGGVCVAAVVIPLCTFATGFIVAWYVRRNR